MSNSLKQDVINAVGEDRYIKHCNEIAQLYDDAERGICSNIETNDNKLGLYMVRFSMYHEGYTRSIHRFVFAINEEDAKSLVLKRYENYNNIDITSVISIKIDITRGLMFNG